MTVCKKILCLSLTFSLFSAQAFAATNSTALSDQASSNHPWFVGAALGWSWTSLSKSKTTVFNGSSQPAPTNLDRYSIKTPNSTGSFGVFAGYRWQRDNAWLPFYSLAVRYQHLTRFKIKGSIEQYSLPAFRNYNYRAYNYSNIFTLQGKADIYKCHSISPFVSAGLGIAGNTVNGFKETAVSGIIPRTSPDYKSKTLHNFTYNLGLGIDYFINPDFTVSLGYEFADLGNAETGKGKGTWSNQSLKFGHLYTNTVLLNVSYQLPI